MIRPVMRFLVALAAAATGAVTSGQAESTRIHWREPIEVASGAAYQGPWRMNASRFDYVDDPTVAIADEGIVAVANSTFEEGETSHIWLYRGKSTRE